MCIRDSVSIECLKGCARNYRCHFGDHSLWFNNCHYFANRLSSVLCTSKEGLCPSWCLKSCDDATDYTTEGVWRPISAYIWYKNTFTFEYSCNSQFRHVNHSEISDESDRCWWNHHCNEAILSYTLTLVAYVKSSEFTKFEACWWIKMSWIPI